MRVSRTVLREAEGVTPSAYSPSHFVARSRGQRAGTILMHRFKPYMDPLLFANITSHVEINVIAPVYSACCGRISMLPGPDGDLRSSSLPSLRLVIADGLNRF